MREIASAQQFDTENNLAKKTFLDHETSKVELTDNDKERGETMVELLKVVREGLRNNEVVEDIITNNTFVSNALLETREKDELTFRHTLGVTSNVITLLNANNGQFGPDLSRAIILASLIHDVGKNDEKINPLVKKGGDLSQSECDIVKKHSRKGFDFLKGLNHLLAAKILIQHHELGEDEAGLAKRYPRAETNANYDGPERRIPDPQIEAAARILAISDVFDALISERSYKEAMTIDQCEEILRNKFRQESDQRNIDILVDGFKNQNL